MAVTNIFTSIQKNMTPDIVSLKDKDILIKSKSREMSKKKLEEFLFSKNIKFKSVFKKSKSSSIDVLTLTDSNIDIIFKPIIQKGAGGLSFEKELAKDLENFYQGAVIEEYTHGDVIKALEKELKLKMIDRVSVILEGSKNQKRALQFSNGKITISNSTGETLTDITLLNRANSSKIYLSLKMSKSYYVLSASIYKFFLDKETQVGVNTFFGFDGIQMGGFGKEYACQTPEPNYTTVASNLATLLSNAVGTKLVLVHKKATGDVLVKKVGATNEVTITGLNLSSYSYPIVNVRKYANIKATAVINGKSYTVNFQFRGTTAADTGPKYLRILLERM
jgi:hypothetical protein